MALGESGEIKAKSEKSEERLEEVDDLVRVLREKLAEHSKDKNELTLQVEQLKSKLLRSKMMSPSNDSDNDDKSSDVLVSKLRDEIEYLSSRVLDYEEEKDELAAKVEVLQDQAEQLKDEVIIEKSKSEKFQSDTKELTSQLEESKKLEEESLKKNKFLEGKLDGQMKELNEIETNHHKTKLKLKEIIKQAEIEINKMNKEKSLMNSNIQSLEQEISETNAKVTSLEKVQNNFQKKYKKVEEENKQLRKSLNLPLPSKTASKHQESDDKNLFTSI